MNEGKGNADLLKVWTGPEGFLASYGSVTTVQDGGKVVSLTYPQEILLVLTSAGG